jgi:hypothetical protein
LALLTPEVPLQSYPLAAVDLQAPAELQRVLVAQHVTLFFAVLYWGVFGAPAVCALC